jgi:hypothetical protein
MKRKPPTEDQLLEGRKLKELWDINKKTSQAEFGKQFDLGNQAYVGQCLHGKVRLNLKAGMAFASHLNVHLSEFSPRLDDELAKIVDFDNDQKSILITRKLFEAREK